MSYTLRVIFTFMTLSHYLLSRFQSEGCFLWFEFYDLLLWSVLFGCTEFIIGLWHLTLLLFLRSIIWVIVIQRNSFSPLFFLLTIIYHLTSVCGFFGFFEVTLCFLLSSCGLRRILWSDWILLEESGFDQAFRSKRFFMLDPRFTGTHSMFVGYLSLNYIFEYHS